MILETLNRLVSNTDRKDIHKNITAPGVPIYESDPQVPGRVIRIMPDGTKESGIIKGGVFTCQHKDSSKQ
jgi:hypothetical protein